jgi:7-cyano-7-deazaguanine reductase
MKKNPLGKKIIISNKYSPNLLFGIARETAREKNKIDDMLYKGFDVWNCYELSWLDKNGKPVARRIKIIYPANSVNIIESKSLKLYLNSFSFTLFNTDKEVASTIKKDLIKLLKTEDVQVLMFNYDRKIKYNKIPKNLLIDDINVGIDTYKQNAKLLKTENGKRSIVERYSNLLMTTCPITQQPDWATVYIKYKSTLEITDESLLKYIVSLRGLSEYHESCCEKIFFDIFKVLNPDLLVVKCFYNRRGGIDINPVRFFGINDIKDKAYHFWRQ